MFSKHYFDKISLFISLVIVRVLIITYFSIIYNRNNTSHHLQLPQYLQHFHLHLIHQIHHHCIHALLPHPVIFYHFNDVCCTIIHFVNLAVNILKTTNTNNVHLGVAAVGKNVTALNDATMCEPQLTQLHATLNILSRMSRRGPYRLYNTDSSVPISQEQQHGG